MAQDDYLDPQEWPRYTEHPPYGFYHEPVDPFTREQAFPEGFDDPKAWRPEIWRAFGARRCNNCGTQMGPGPDEGYQVGAMARSDTGPGVHQYTYDLCPHCSEIPASHQRFIRAVGPGGKAWHMERHEMPAERTAPEAAPAPSDDGPFTGPDTGPPPEPKGPYTGDARESVSYQNPFVVRLVREDLEDEGAEQVEDAYPYVNPGVRRADQHESPRTQSWVRYNPALSKEERAMHQELANAWGQEVFGEGWKERPGMAEGWTVKAEPPLRLDPPEEDQTDDWMAETCSNCGSPISKYQAPVFFEKGDRDHPTDPYYFTGVTCTGCGEGNLEHLREVFAQNKQYIARHEAWPWGRSKEEPAARDLLPAHTFARPNPERRERHEPPRRQEQEIEGGDPERRRGRRRWPVEGPAGPRPERAASPEPKPPEDEPEPEQRKTTESGGYDDLSTALVREWGIPPGGFGHGARSGERWGTPFDYSHHPAPFGGTEETGGGAHPEDDPPFAEAPAPQAPSTSLPAPRPPSAPPGGGWTVSPPPGPGPTRPGGPLQQRALPAAGTTGPRPSTPAPAQPIPAEWSYIDPTAPEAQPGPHVEPSEEEDAQALGLSPMSEFLERMRKVQGRRAASGNEPAPAVAAPRPALAAPAPPAPAGPLAKPHMPHVPQIKEPTAPAPPAPPKSLAGPRGRGTTALPRLGRLGATLEKEAVPLAEDAVKLAPLAL